MKRTVTMQLFGGVSCCFLALVLAACGGKLQVGQADSNGLGAKPPGGTETTTQTPVQLDFTTVDPQTGVVTRKTCAEPTDCAPSGAVCIQGGGGGRCYEEKDPCAKITCGRLERCERGKGKFEAYGFCVPNCKEAEQCGGVCRSSDSAVCVDFQWVEPCADSRQHCVTEAGPVCCNAGSECLYNRCVEVTADCDLANGVYCKITEYCDPSVHKCVEYEPNKDAICRYKVTDINKADLKLYWDDVHVSSYGGVYVTPAVANLTDDNGDGKIDENDVPDIVFIPYSLNGFDGALYAIKSVPKTSNIKDVEVIWTRSSEYVYTHIAPVIADLDKGEPGEVIGPEIIVVTAGGGNPVGVAAYHADGTLYRKASKTSSFSTWAGGSAVGDVNGDGKPEILALGSLWSHDLKELTVITDYYVQNSLPILADMNLDGKLDVVDGKNVFIYTGNGTTFTFDRISGAAGIPAEDTGTSSVADFTKDKSTYPQIANVHKGVVTLLDHKGVVLDTAVAPSLSTDERGGAPTIADFDGDGLPEIGVAFASSYSVYDVNEDPSTGVPKLSLLWYFRTQDQSSALTGSSVFDFDADGAAEVVYNDEVNLYILRGNAGKGGVEVTEPLLKIPNSHGTASESAVIADVDNDGHADIVVTSAVYGGGTDKGVKIFSNPNWAPTRPIWNQHAYSVTNINDDGTVPRVRTKNWTKRWLNNFRQNVQAGNPFLAPDFIVKVAPLYQNGCVAGPLDKLQLNYDVWNQGSVPVKGGKLKVVVKAVLPDGSEEEVASHVVGQDLPTSAKVSFSDPLMIKGTSLEGKVFDLKFIVDADNGYRECYENNNEFVIPKVGGDAVDASVEVVVTNPFSCPSEHKADVQLKVFNNGKGVIPANTLQVKLYAKVGSGTERLIDTVNVTEDIPAEDSVTVMYEWTPFDSSDMSKMVTIRAVVDEGNTLLECNESNNSAENVFVCQQLG